MQQWGGCPCNAQPALFQLVAILAMEQCCCSPLLCSSYPAAFWLGWHELLAGRRAQLAERHAPAPCPAQMQCQCQRLVVTSCSIAPLHAAAATPLIHQPFRRMLSEIVNHDASPLPMADSPLVWGACNVAACHRATCTAAAPALQHSCCAPSLPACSSASAAPPAAWPALPHALWPPPHSLLQPPAAAAHALHAARPAASAFSGARCSRPRPS